MKLIIDIPDEEYNQIKEWGDSITGYQTSLVLYRAVRNGIPYEEEKPFEINVFLENADESTLFDIKKELARILTERAEKEAYEEEHTAISLAIKALEDRPQGEWYYSYLNGWHCSICHGTVKDMPTVMGKAYFNFCPNCGANMRKGGAE